VQSLHRVREHFKVQRVANINFLRGTLREFGITIPMGAAKVRPAVLAALADGENDLAMDLRHTLAAVLAQIEQQESEIKAIETRLAAFARRDLRSQRLLLVPGIGLITATAVSASVGELERFKSGRHFASWLGLIPREHSSGNHRRLGRVTKRGDIYLRTLLIHGARSMMLAARRAKAKGKALDPLRSWAADLAERVGHNKAAVAVANKLARRLWAAEHHRTAFNAAHESFPNCPITL
jgi:transposase